MCVSTGMRYLCAIHIIDAYSSTNKENASPSMCMYAYIYVHIYIHIIWLQWHSKRVCALGVLIQHIAMAYAITMLPTSQGALETSVSTWRLQCIWYIEIVYTCSKIVRYYHIWNYFLTKHQHYIHDSFHAPDQRISTKSITCSKNGITHPLVLFPVVLFFWRIMSMFLPFFFAAAHAASRSFSGYDIPLCYMPLAYYINFAKYCQYAVVFFNVKNMHIILFFKNAFVPFVFRSWWMSIVRLFTLAFRSRPLGRGYI